jgi:hypothetical protein
MGGTGHPSQSHAFACCAGMEASPSNSTPGNTPSTRSSDLNTVRISGLATLWREAGLAQHRCPRPTGKPE